MKWTVHEETPVFCEYHESEIGRVERIGLEGWDAWLYVTDAHRGAGTYKVGEGYSTAAAAKAAVTRQWNKLPPVS